MQKKLLASSTSRPKGQLLKWIGNKYRFAYQIVNTFPIDYKVFYEPFVGTGAILATLNPKKSVAGDALAPLIELWQLVQTNEDKIMDYYEKNWNAFIKKPHETYNKIKANYNQRPNGLDLLFISRTCYGGVMRFTREGKISTPLGPHKPINPETFSLRLRDWKSRVMGTTFVNQDYTDVIKRAGKKDLIYCDPPYVDSQSILYGAQKFNFDVLIDEIKKAKKRGAYIALSIDGSKKSGKKIINLNIPTGLFSSEIFIDSGSSMLRRLQKRGELMDGEGVKERLLITW